MAGGEVLHVWVGSAVFWFSLFNFCSHYVKGSETGSFRSETEKKFEKSLPTRGGGWSGNCHKGAQKSTKEHENLGENPNSTTDFTDEHGFWGTRRQAKLRQKDGGRKMGSFAAGSGKKTGWVIVLGRVRYSGSTTPAIQRTVLIAVVVLGHRALLWFFNGMRVVGLGNSDLFRAAGGQRTTLAPIPPEAAMAETLQPLLGLFRGRHSDKALWPANVF